MFPLYLPLVSGSAQILRRVTLVSAAFAHVVTQAVDPMRLAILYVEHPLLSAGVLSCAYTDTMGTCAYIKCRPTLVPCSVVRCDYGMVAWLCCVAFWLLGRVFGFFVAIVGLFGCVAHIRSPFPPPLKILKDERTRDHLLKDFHISAARIP